MKCFSVRAANGGRKAPTLGCLQAGPSSCQPDCGSLLLALLLSSFRALELQGWSFRAPISAFAVFASVKAEMGRVKPNEDMSC